MKWLAAYACVIFGIVLLGLALVGAFWLAEWLRLNVPSDWWDKIWFCLGGWAFIHFLAWNLVTDKRLY